MKTNKIVISILFISYSILFQAQNLKVMFYNLMHYPSTYVYDNTSNTFIDRSEILKSITDEIQPDIMMVCELQNITGANAILNNVLNVETNKYASANFVYNQSTSYTDLNQFIYYNSEKLILENQNILTTLIRDINHYTFLLNTTEKEVNPVYLEVFVAHLKASQNTTNQQKRLEMVTVFTDNLATIPNNHHIIFAGDFNFYTNSETGYQKIIDPNNAIIMIDPAHQEGSWHNNYTYKNVQTQSPLTTNSHFSANYGTSGSGSDGVTGGLDDRFDFIMIDQNTETSPNLQYINGSYKVFGNNGTCFNNNIDDTDCSGAEFSQTTRENLSNMSDHLPVILELTTNQTFLNTSDISTFKINTNNLVKNLLSIEINTLTNPLYYEIFNNLGQKIKKGNLFHKKTELNISEFKKGLYFLKIENIKTIKFIKL